MKKNFASTPREVWDGRLFCLLVIVLGAALHYLYPRIEGIGGVMLDIFKIGCVAFGSIALLCSFYSSSQTLYRSGEPTPQLSREELSEKLRQLKK